VSDWTAKPFGFDLSLVVLFGKPCAVRCFHLPSNLVITLFC
jgi:hypothetical protein